MRRGLFLVLEGLDGSGSTTQMQELATYLRGRQEPVFITHQPSNGPVGMLIRLALSRRLVGANHTFHVPDEPSLASQSALDPITLGLLYAADRMDHITTQVEPNLSRGRHVICDRYLMSSLAYQGVEIDQEWLLNVNRYAPIPDATIFIDVSASEARDRMARTRWTKDLFEDEDLQARIRANFKKLIKNPPPCLGPVISVDGARPVEVVSSEIQKLVLGILARKKASSPTSSFT